MLDIYKDLQLLEDEHEEETKDIIIDEVESLTHLYIDNDEEGTVVTPWYTMLSGIAGDFGYDEQEMSNLLEKHGYIVFKISPIGSFEGGVAVAPEDINFDLVKEDIRHLVEDDFEGSEVPEVEITLKSGNKEKEFDTFNQEETKDDHDYELDALRDRDEKGLNNDMDVDEDVEKGLDEKIVNISHYSRGWITPDGDIIGTDNMPHFCNNHNYEDQSKDFRYNLGYERYVGLPFSSRPTNAQLNKLRDLLDYYFINKNNVGERNRDIEIDYPTKDGDYKFVYVSPKDYTSDEVISLIKRISARIIREKTESLNEDKIPASVRKLVDLINGKIARGTDYRLDCANNKLIIGFGDNKTSFNITKEQCRKLKELGYTKEESLNEGHITNEYKGYELDWNDDALDLENGTVDLTIFIMKNGKEVAQAKSFKEARKWIDENGEPELPKKIHLDKPNPKDYGTDDEDLLSDLEIMPYGEVTEEQWEEFLDKAKYPYWLDWEMLVNEIQGGADFGSIIEECLKKVNESLKEDWDKVSEEDLKKLEDELTSKGFEIVSRKPTIFDDIHYQIITKEGNQNEETFNNYVDIIETTLDKFEEDTGAPCTFNAGLQVDGYISCGFDIRKIYYEKGNDIPAKPSGVKLSFRNGKPADDYTKAHIQDIAKHMNMSDDEVVNAFPLDKKNEALENSQIGIHYDNLDLTLLGKWHKPTWDNNGGDPGYYEEEDVTEDYVFNVSAREVRDVLIDLISVEDEFKNMSDEEILNYVEEHLGELVSKYEEDLRNYFYDQAKEEAREYYQQLKDEETGNVEEGFIDDLQQELARKFLPPQKKKRQRKYYEVYWYEGEKEDGDPIGDPVFKTFSTRDAANKWYQEHRNDSDKFQMDSPYECVDEALENKIRVKDINVGDIVGEFDTPEEAQAFIDDDHGDHNYVIDESVTTSDGDELDEFETYKDAYNYLDRYAREHHIENYDIVEDSYEVPHGLLFIEYDDYGNEISHYPLVCYKTKSKKEGLEEDKKALNRDSKEVRNLYKEYVKEWKQAHSGPEYKGMEPACFDEWYDNEYLDSLEEDIEKHDTLNPLLFENNELKPDVKEAIQKIADTFVEELKDNEINLELKDIVLVGSNCSYNYTKDSDIDIHLIVDSSALECPKNLADKLYGAYRAIFNGNYDITIKGIPAEIYVEMDDIGAAKSNGIYSLKDGWIKEPVQQDIPELDREAFDKLYNEWSYKYEELLNNENATSEDVKNLIDEIYVLRKEGIAEEGEYSLKNLVFKELRNTGVLDDLKAMRREFKGKELSLEHLEEAWSTIDPYDDEEVKVAKEIAKKCKLSKDDYEMLLDDIYNLRGNEWLKEVRKTKDKNLIKRFKEVSGMDESLEEDINTTYVWRKAKDTGSDWFLVKKGEKDIANNFVIRITKPNNWPGWTPRNIKVFNKNGEILVSEKEKEKVLPYSLDGIKQYFINNLEKYVEESLEESKPLKEYTTYWFGEREYPSKQVDHGEYDPHTGTFADGTTLDDLEDWELEESKLDDLKISSYKYLLDVYDKDGNFIERKFYRSRPEADNYVDALPDLYDIVIKNKEIVDLPKDKTFYGTYWKVIRDIKKDESLDEELDRNTDTFYKTLDTGATFDLPTLDEYKGKDSYILPIDSKNWDDGKPSLEEFNKEFFRLADKYKNKTDKKYVIGTYHGDETGRYSVDISFIVPDTDEEAIKSIDPSQENVGHYDSDGKYSNVPNPNYKGK